MRLARLVGIVDTGIAAVVIVMIALPAREMYAVPAHPGSEAEQFGLALAVARTQAAPTDGAATATLSRRLSDAGFKDWAIESAVAGATRAAGAPTEWLALRAASFAYVDHLDAAPALADANRALAACHANAAVCPAWEEVKLNFYQRDLEAGVQSGIDPHRDPVGFRAAAEASLHTVRINGQQPVVPEAPAPGSGSGSAQP